MVRPTVFSQGGPLVHEVHHFTHGISTPAFAYLAAVIGSATGLSATSRARVTGSWRQRSGWLLLAALAIGGTGIWVMHFVAMLGFSVTGMPIHYDVGLTVVSAVVAVVVVAVGLHLVVLRDARPAPLLLGGAIAGLGVAAMHYLGMAAMDLSGTLHYSPLYVALSVVIAVVAATVALWLCVHTRGALMTTAAALVMGVAVAGMHYTGMTGVQATGPAGPADGGVPASTLLGPLILVGAGIVVIMGLVVLAAPTEAELREEAVLDAQREGGLLDVRS